jgi:hypothetical protein
MTCVESYETTNKLKQKETRYTVNAERFRLACDLWGVPWGQAESYDGPVPLRNARHAWQYAVLFAKAAQDAPQRKVTVVQQSRPGRPGGAQGRNWVRRV